MIVYMLLMGQGQKLKINSLFLEGQITITTRIQHGKPLWDYFETQVL